MSGSGTRSAAAGAGGYYSTKAGSINATSMAKAMA
jgi:hypothetical protein